MKIEDMNRDERSLLLYLETTAVDFGGKIDGRRMNKIDFDIAKRWNDTKFVQFGRIAAENISHNYTHWCVLSEEAWTEAHRERRARNCRVESKLNIRRIGIDS